MPLGGPSSGLGGDRFAGRAMPPKAKKSRKSVQTVQVQDEFDDGNSSRGDYDEEGDGDDYDPLTGKKRKRHRAGPGGDSLTCHQVSSSDEKTEDRDATDLALAFCSAAATTSLDFDARGTRSRARPRPTSSASSSIAIET